MAVKKVLKIDNIIKISPDETLSSALVKLRSSHDAAFVFDENNKYLGVINPYHCVIKSSYPSNAKVIHCLFHPPKIYIDFSLVKVAQFFIDSKVHYLPVFDEKENFLGIISARRLLSYFINDNDFKIKIEKILKNKKPLKVINVNENLSTALNVFKSTKFSKLVVVDNNFKLKGILSYFDLVYYLMSPKTSPGKGDREGNKISFFHQPVKKFIKTFVLTLTKDNFLSEVIDLILEKKVGSVVIVEEKKKPVGIITTRDILHFFIKKEKEKEKPPIFRRFLNGVFSSKKRIS